VEDAFRQVEGVTSVTSGYTGGTMKNPDLQDVCGGRTGHAEAVQVEFDPSRVSYLEPSRRLLEESRPNDV